MLQNANVTAFTIFESVCVCVCVCVFVFVSVTGLFNNYLKPMVYFWIKHCKKVSEYLYRWVLVGSGAV